MIDFANVKVVKRDGKVVPFNKTNISTAIKKAVRASHDNIDINSNESIVRNSEVVNTVVKYVEKELEDKGIDSIHVEKIQDMTERSLIKHGYADTAKEYILYRQRRNEIRNTQNKTAECIDEILNKDSKASDLKRDNANINGDTAMGTMLQIGANISKQYYLDNRINKTASTAHQNGYIHIHDLDFYDLTVTCCQIDIEKLFKNGFNTGHGFLREPNGISTAASLAAIAIQSDQNDCHGGQSIPNFDYALAKYVQKTFNKRFKESFTNLFRYSFNDYNIPDSFFDHDAIEMVEKSGYTNLENSTNSRFMNAVNSIVKYMVNNKYIYDTMLRAHLETMIKRIIHQSFDNAYKLTDHDTFQAMEGFIHNCNTLHSRAGAQVNKGSLVLEKFKTVIG